MKLSKEGCFEFAVTMIIGVVRLEHLVEPFEQERPESMEWPEVHREFSSMSRIMIVWFQCSRSIKLWVTRQI